MYSRGGSTGYGRSDVEGGRGYNDTNSNILEQQNNERIYELSEQVARLKVNNNTATVVVITLFQSSSERVDQEESIFFSHSICCLLLPFTKQGLTIDIGNEVREQNSLLDQMGSGFESTRDMLQGSLARIGVMLDTSSGKHMCYMVLFVVFVVIFLYWLMTFKGQSGA